MFYFFGREMLSQFKFIQIFVEHVSNFFDVFGLQRSEPRDLNICRHFIQLLSPLYSHVPPKPTEVDVDELPGVQ